KWYGTPHACPDLLGEAVYGLPEMNRNDIKTARLVANPGCYPTSVQLGYAPLLRHGLVDATNLIADCKSGVSGAGRGASIANLQAESSESVKAYAVSGHRHNPEIVQGLQLLNSAAKLTFVPHLMPMIRGIHATLYADLVDQSVDLQDLYEKHYENEPFVDVMPAGSTPETRSVKGSNMCRLAIYRLENTNKVIILSVIDNLLKGAAGQAIQNMNVMFNFDESKGLEGIAILP
ncbi:MAG: N-acetyl-gamma-glutamyl-phosphate reductase, partial [Gammaproteobacteria bacterium]|nr:N-acetyl-gamma-glutamyl-phosphate reductase [Gammaproteobacteria bacterium]